MTQEQILSHILKIEEQEGVNDLYFENIPIWNILKYRLRGYYCTEMGINDITNHSKKNKNPLAKRFKYICKSLSAITKLIISKNKIPYCFVGFTRLEEINGEKMDKFIDPIVSECRYTNKDYIYFNNESVHPINRIDNNIVYTDLIDVFSKLVSIFVFPFLFIKNRRTFIRINNVTRSHFTKNKKAILYLYLKPTIIYIQHYIYKAIFKHIGTKALIGVSRPTFFPQTLAAKKLSIKVIELQHGITHGLTNLYSGVYNEKIDPDYFCTFGDSCPKNVFNIDESKIINIGFALNSFLKRINNKGEGSDNSVLVISEPEPSELILSVVIKLAKLYPGMEFHIRRHPQEVYSESQNMRINQIPNVKDVSSSECSQLAILPYHYIVGDNSSVLFEALSIGKKVGRFNCEGLMSQGYLPGNNDGFCYINELKDFDSFIKTSVLSNGNRTIYSDFNVKLFKQLIS